MSILKQTRVGIIARQTAFWVFVSLTFSLVQACSWWESEPEEPEISAKKPEQEEGYWSSIFGDLMEEGDDDDGVQAFFGAVVADEPQAALVGREILSGGGNAIDAATAMFFALSVTYPSSASLGGGGVCVVHEHFSTKTESLEFLARKPRAVPPTADRPTGVPGNVSGFFSLHSKYGRMRWQHLVASAEKMARFGVTTSRALALDLAKVERALMADRETFRIFARPDGKGLVEEGDILKQPDLAEVLKKIRQQGAAAIYGGSLTGDIIASANAARGSLNVADLGTYKTAWSKTVRAPFDEKIVHFAPPPAAAGAVAAEIWSALEADEKYAESGPRERHHLVAESAARIFADRDTWMRADGTSSMRFPQLTNPSRIASLMADYRAGRHVPLKRGKSQTRARVENPAATSLVVIDSEGSAVSCALSMNNLFGAGRIAKGLGFFLAAMPGSAARGPHSLGPMLLLDEETNDLTYASAASGGVAAPTAMVGVAARVQMAEEPLEYAITAKRLHHAGYPDTLYYEKGMAAETIRDLKQKGHRLAPTGKLGRVNAISCSGGDMFETETCSAKADPRGYGLGVVVPPPGF
jgi:gamma-glutamyltranspeptidase / glutathione hydrolase